MDDPLRVQSHQGEEAEGQVPQAAPEAAPEPAAQAEHPAGEPSVLDYVKAVLMPWTKPDHTFPPLVVEERPEPSQVLRPGQPAVATGRGEPISAGIGDDGVEDMLTGEPAAAARPLRRADTSAADMFEEPEPQVEGPPQADDPVQVSGLPFRSLGALALALAAQRSLEPYAGRTWYVAAGLYALAALLFIWAYHSGEWRLPAHPPSISRQDPLTVRPTPLLIGVVMLLAAYYFFGGSVFTFTNTVLWLGGTALLAYSFWLPARDSGRKAFSWASLGRLARSGWMVRISAWSVVVLLALAVSAFFRFYRLSDVPPEMVSDHAEKLLDVYDVLNGELHIYFIRNTGREFFQMYLTAAMIKLFGTGYSFLSLKLGTVIGGMVTLPFIYLAGKEAANRRAGLIALAFAGIAYWPNLISRIGLRFTLYPLFFAPVLYFLLRGLRTSNRNDFILAGLFLGLGLHGYSPYRIVPVLVVIGIVLYMLHRQSKGQRYETLWWLGVLALVAFAVFVPLMRYAVDNPEMFSYRAMTRLSGIERPLPDAPLRIFFSNLWRALTMFAWDNGEVWVISISHRSVLDWITSAIFHLGIVAAIVRYMRSRNWVDLFLLVSIPVLMMPSILSLAFPNENPSLNRTAGAIVPVFLLVGLGLDSVLSSLKVRLGSALGSRLAWTVGLALFAWACVLNYNMVFKQYQTVYKASSWNTSELGQVVHEFANTIGSPDTAWVVAYPHWVDSRLVMVHAGYAGRDNALWPDQISTTINDPRAKLFLINLQDTAAVQTLESIYPQGWLQTYPSKADGRSFLMYFVPPLETGY